jgi:hypothetical protein
LSKRGFRIEDDFPQIFTEKITELPTEGRFPQIGLVEISPLFSMEDI